MSQQPLADFFARYPDFDYRPSCGATNEFQRLCEFYGWEEEGWKRKRAYKAFRNALVVQFNCYFGTDVDDIDSWASLCAAIGVNPVPQTLQECRKAVKSAYVNLVDLVDHCTGRSNRPVRVFATEMDLSNYTKESDKIFPKENAKAGGVLKYLLRQIFNPNSSKRGGAARRKRRA